MGPLQFDPLERCLYAGQWTVPNISSGAVMRIFQTTGCNKKLEIKFMRSLIYDFYQVSLGQ
jgi:hypothetical protein